MVLYYVHGNLGNRKALRAVGKVLESHGQEKAYQPLHNNRYVRQVEVTIWSEVGAALWLGASEVLAVCAYY